MPCTTASHVRQIVGRAALIIAIGGTTTIALADGGEHLRDQAAGYRAEAITLQQHGDVQGAIPLLQKAIHLDSSYPTPHNDLGILYESVGRVAEAEREYQTAIALNPGYAQAHTNLALLYERQGKKELAGHHWLQRYNIGAPDDPWTRTAHEHLVALGYLKGEMPSGPVDLRGRVSGSPQQRAAEEQMNRYETVLREFEAITDPGGQTWNRRPYTTTTGTQSH